MANQPPPARPWFRIGSLARPALPTAPEPPAPAPQPRPAIVRPTFRPLAQPAPPPAQPRPTAAPRAPTGSASVPQSPERRASQPPSPIAKTTTSSEVAPAPATSPTKPQVGTSSLPTSPAKISSTITPAPATASVTTSPIKTVPAAPLVSTSPPKTVAKTTSLPSSPAPKPAPITAAATRAPSPSALLRTVKPVAQTPPQSPKQKPTAPPPSPLTLPPPQLNSQAERHPRIPAEAEQKTVLVQKKVEKPKGSWLNEDSQKGGIAKDVEAKAKGNHKKFSSDSEDGGVRIITIAGENKGAFMELIQSPQKHGFAGTPNKLVKEGHSKTLDNSSSEWQSYKSTSSSDDEKGKKKDKSRKAAAQAHPMNAYMNSNVQGINNSILFNSSCTHNDPGVHVSFQRKPGGGGFHVKEHGNGYNS